MSSNPLFRYGARLAYQPSWWWPPVLVMAYLVSARVGCVPWHHLILFEVFLPLLGATYVVPVMVSDKEQGSWQLLLSYPGDRLWVLASRLAAPALVATALLGFSWVGARMLGLEAGSEVLLWGAPGLVFLVGMAAWSSVVLPTALAAWLAPLGWWTLNFVTRGRFTRSFYLFAAAYPEAGTDLTVSKWVLLVSGCAWLVMATVHFKRYARG